MQTEQQPALMSCHGSVLICHCCFTADGIERAELGLPDQVMHELQAEAAVMSRMRHPK